MKKLIIAFILVALTAAGYSQSKWDGFFKPIEKNEFLMRSNLADKAIVDMLKVRPVVSLTAYKVSKNKDTGKMESSSFTSGGVGLGLEHFIEVNGTPYNNWGVEALVLFTMIPTETVKTGTSLVVAFSALNIISVGPGYDLTNKQFFVLTGITFNFN
jgi:hypothetical protein